MDLTISRKERGEGGEREREREVGEKEEGRERVINSAPGPWFVLKLILLAQIIPGPVYPYRAESWLKTPFICSMLE